MPKTRRRRCARQTTATVAADCWREGDANRYRTERGERCELARVVFPQGKHEHILARGLFRQIGDCCGGERKGSSQSPLLPPPSPSPSSSLTPPSAARCLCHQRTAPRHSVPQTRCTSYRCNDRTRHYVEIRRECGGRTTETNGHTDRGITEAEVAE